MSDCIDGVVEFCLVSERLAGVEDEGSWIHLPELMSWAQLIRIQLDILGIWNLVKELEQSNQNMRHKWHRKDKKKMDQEIEGSIDG